MRGHYLRRIYLLLLLLSLLLLLLLVSSSPRKKTLVADPTESSYFTPVLGANSFANSPSALPRPKQRPLSWTHAHTHSPPHQLKHPSRRRFSITSVHQPVPAFDLFTTSPSPKTNPPFQTTYFCVYFSRTEPLASQRNHQQHRLPIHRRTGFHRPAHSTIFSKPPTNPRLRHDLPLTSATISCERDFITTSF